MGQFFKLRSRVQQEYNDLLVNALNRIFESNLSLNTFKWLLTKVELSCVRNIIPRSRKRLWNGYPVLNQKHLFWFIFAGDFAVICIIRVSVRQELTVFRFRCRQFWLHWCGRTGIWSIPGTRLIPIVFNPYSPGDFAEKRVLKLLEWFSGHCRAIKS